jgi:hypothetical protein
MRPMRHVIRHLFTLVSALSLLLCVAGCVLWVASRHQSRGVSYDLGTHDGVDRCISVTSEDGQVYFVAANLRAWVDQSIRADYGGFPSDYNRFLGFGFGHRDPRPFSRNADVMLGFTFLTLPHWFLALLTGFPAAARFRSRAARLMRSRQGRCPTCGYDLRAHVAGDRCPECGTAVMRAA